MRVRHPDGQTFTFDAGALCLELSLSGGEGLRARFEQLHAPADLPAWAARGRLGDVAAAATCTAGELALAKRLREAVWDLAWAAATGGEPGPGSAATVNEVAALPTPVPRLGADGAQEWPGVTGAGLAALYARDAVAVFGTAARRRVRMCGAANCALIYLDTSRAGNRRWCSMERCGNRAKVRAHREREVR